MDMSPSQGDEAGVGRTETAALEVERTQVLVEVDVQPFAAGCPRLAHSDRDELRPDSLSPHTLGHERVEDERMYCAVPGHVHEPDEFTVLPSAGLTEAVLVDLSPPVVVQGAMAESFSMQGVDHSVVEVAAPFVGDHRRNGTSAQSSWESVLSSCRCRAIHLTAVSMAKERFMDTDPALTERTVSTPEELDSA